MRVSTQQIFNNAVSQMQKSQTSLAQTQERIATGKELLRPSDDPVAAAQILKLEREVSRTEKFEDNITATERRLQLEETTLDQIDTAIDRLKELTIQAGNGTLSDADRKTIAENVRQVQDSILSLMNTRDAQGEYLFSGSQGTTQPYIQNGDGSFSYQGDDGQRVIQVGPELQVPSSDSGRSIFEVVTDDVTISTRGESTNRASLVTGISVTDSDKLEAFTAQSGNLTAAVKVGIGGAFTYSLRDSSGAAVSGSVNGATDAPLDNLAFATSPADTLSLNGLEFSVNELPALGGFNDTRLSVGVYQGAAPNEVNSTRAINPTMLSSGDQYAQFAAVQGDLSVNFFDDGLGNPNSLTYTVTSEAGNTLVGATVYVPGSSDTITMQDGGANDLFSVKINGAQADSTSVTLRAQAEVDLQADQGHHSVLQTTQELITALETPITDSASRDALNKAVAKANEELVIAKEGNLQAQTMLGGRQNSLNTAKEVNADFKLFTQTALSQIQDLDYAAAISEFSLQEMALQASQATFTRVSSLSLFNFF